MTKNKKFPTADLLFDFVLCVGLGSMTLGLLPFAIDSFSKPSDTIQCYAVSLLYPCVVVVFLLTIITLANKLSYNDVKNLEEE